MWRCEGPHCFAQKRPRTFASALQRVAAVEASKNPLSRDFRYRSIFDFCNNTRSKAEVARDERHVWFTPKSRHRQSVPACPKSANFGSESDTIRAPRQHDQSTVSYTHLRAHET